MQCVPYGLHPSSVLNLNENRAGVTWPFCLIFDVLSGSTRIDLTLVGGSQIPLPPVDEKKKVTEDVEKDRRYAIDAAIVRTMKSRKTLNHQGVGLLLLRFWHLTAAVSQRLTASIFASGIRKQLCHSMDISALVVYQTC